MNIYDRVKKILEKHPRTRNSDKELIWRVWQDLDLILYNQISKSSFYNAPSNESITRARRKVQELNEDLRAIQKVKQKRAYKEDLKGNFVFFENL